MLTTPAYDCKMWISNGLLFIFWVYVDNILVSFTFNEYKNTPLVANGKNCNSFKETGKYHLLIPSPSTTYN